jgi:antirestriction protein
MRVWIGCLASYNNGRLIGEWFDVSTDADENSANIAKILRSSPYPNVTRTDEETGESYATAEEYFCADYDETPRALTDALGEYPSAELLATAAELLATVESRFDDEDEASAVIGEMLDGRRLSEVDDADEWISEHYAGSGDTLAAWCEAFLEGTGGLEGMPENLRPYFDFESYARDMRLGGEISEVRVGGVVMVFWNR